METAPELFNANDPAHLDNKNRIRPEFLTDRELLIETVTMLRTTQDALESFVGSAAKNPMLKMLGIGK